MQQQHHHHQPHQEKPITDIMHTTTQSQFDDWPYDCSYTFSPQFNSGCNTHQTILPPSGGLSFAPDRHESGQHNTTRTSISTEDVTSSAAVFSQASYPVECFSGSCQPVPSSAPYSGEYGFELKIQKQTKETKSAMWTYSDKTSKLYVRTAVSCPFIYWTQFMPHDNANLVIRITPIYARPEHVREVVRRCPNHAAATGAASMHYALLDETAETANRQNDAERMSFVRVQHPRASYVRDTETGRYSVILPYEQPQAGADWVTTLLEFHCFSSCVGGLNRRPVLVVFSLERPSDGSVIGRQSVEVRVCACPVRDRQTEERALPTSSSTVHDSGSVLNTDPSTLPLPGKRSDKISKRASDRMMNKDAVSDKRQRRDDSTDDGNIFTLVVRDRNTYEILSRLRDCLEMSSLIPSHLLDQYRTQFQQPGQLDRSMAAESECKTSDKLQTYNLYKTTNTLPIAW